jgi:hypothetical protein
MGRKQKIKQARHEKSAGGTQPRNGLPAANRIRYTWLLVVLGLLLVMLVTAGTVFYKNRASLFKAAMLAQSYQIGEQLKTRLGRFTAEDGAHLQAIVGEVQTIANLPGFDTPAAGQLKFILGVLDEIVQAGELEAGEIEKLEAQVQAVRSYLNRQQRPRRP